MVSIASLSNVGTTGIARKPSVGRVVQDYEILPGLFHV